MTTVTDMYSTAQSTAESLMTSMTQFSDALSEEIRSSDSLAVQLSDGQYTPDNSDAGTASTSSAPSIAVPTIEGDNLTKPAYEPIVPIIVEGFSEPRPFTSEYVGTDNAGKPDRDLPGAPDAAPDYIGPVIADPQAITLPPLPKFDLLTVTPAPVFEIDPFKSTVDIETLTAPTKTFVFAPADYVTILGKPLTDKLREDLVNGGYGIDTDDEAAMLQRGIDREEQLANTAIDEATRRAASRGFALPPGALSAQIAKVHAQKMMAANSLSRDILIKRADMFVENRKFTIMQAVEVEKTLLSFYANMMEQGLNAAKAVVELGIAQYNASVARANYRLEYKKVEAQIYETQFKSKLSEFEAWRAALEGVKVTAGIQHDIVLAYNAQIEGASIAAKLYNTQLEGAKIASQLELAKLEGFKLRVDAYVATVQAKVAEFSAYEAELRGDTHKASTFHSKAQAYSAEIEAYKSHAAIKIMSTTAAIEAQRLVQGRNAAQAEQYRAELAASQNKTQIEVAKYDADVRKYVAESAAKTRDTESLAQVSREKVNLAYHAARIKADVAIARGQQLLGNHHNAAIVDKGMAEMYANLAKAAMSAASGLLVESA